MRILIVGGSGILGTEIIRQLEPLKSVLQFEYPSHKELDITDKSSIENYLLDKEYDSILLLVGEKNQLSIELDSIKALEINIQGISNVVHYVQEHKCKSIVTYISTGYVYNGFVGKYHKETDGVLPCSKYSWSKLGGECCLHLLSEDKYLIIRCEFSKYPWHRDWAYTDQFTSREEITITANKILNLILLKATGTYNIGGKRQSIWKYAQSLSDKKILKDSRKNSKIITFPKDTSMNTSKYNNLMRKK